MKNIYEQNKKNYCKPNQIILYPFQDNFNDVRIGIRATRIFMALLTVAIVVIVFYTSITVNIRLITVSNPSIDDFGRLYEKLSETLVCPCTKVAIHYRDILTVSIARYHQV